MNRYSNFIDQIPNEIKCKVEKHICSDIALFRPVSYITGKTMNLVDFHFVIPSTPPPDTYVNDRLKSFKRGKIIAVNPGDSMFCNIKDYYTKPYLAMLIKSDLINKIAEEMDYSGGIKFLELNNSFSSQLINAIKCLDEETKRSDSFHLMMDCLGIQIATLLIREFKTNFKKFPANSPDWDTYIYLSIEYMHTYFSSNISINDICREINVSPFHFIRTFKLKTGMSPYQYLLNIRIKRAEELLQSGKYSVAETAMLCGFINLSHFSSTFKGITGHAPREYKKIITIK